MSQNNITNCLICCWSSPKHYDHLPNMLLVLRVPPKQRRPTKAWTLQDPWRCPVVSGTKTSVADSSSPVSCEVEPLWIGLVGPAHPTDAQSDWDLENLEARGTPWTLHHVPQTIHEQCVQCGRGHYPAERGHCHEGQRHGPLAQDDEARYSCRLQGVQAIGLSTQASTPIKWLIRNGWPGCGCTPYRIPLTLKPVFATPASVKQISQPRLCLHQLQTVLSARHSESVRFVRIERHVPHVGPVCDLSRSAESEEAAVCWCEGR